MKINSVLLLWRRRRNIFRHHTFAKTIQDKLSLVTGAAGRIFFRLRRTLAKTLQDDSFLILWRRRRKTIRLARSRKANSVLLVWCRKRIFFDHFGAAIAKALHLRHSCKDNSRQLSHFTLAPQADFLADLGTLLRRQIKTNSVLSLWRRKFVFVKNKLLRTFANIIQDNSFLILWRRRRKTNSIGAHSCEINSVLSS